MITTPENEIGAPAERDTIWGLDPLQLHDRFWAARGVEVVRQGRPSELVHNPELFLLTEPNILTIFRLLPLVETLSWLKPVLLYVRLKEDSGGGYRERAISDADGRFVRFERVYGANQANLTRVALTPHREVALAWQMARDPWSAWQHLRHNLGPDQSTVRQAAGRIYDATAQSDARAFVQRLAGLWRQPDATVGGISEAGRDIWAGPQARVEPRVRAVGPVWVGAGRQIVDDGPLVGPVVLWDDPQARPQVESLRFDQVEPSQVFARAIRPRRHTAAGRGLKRLFDVAFAAVVLALTLPFYPLIMLAIYLEDRRPFFFTHRRETLGGRVFPCLKFRSMRRDAEAVKAQMARANQADGPQFFIENDPRLTRVGRILRRANIDELPQFINVLLGHMSVVGPRPSPYEENQYCPAWRETRLSVRPGLTGLWQVKRSRLEGMDFQEWIRYDIEYVENMSWRLDLWIIWRTIPIILHGVLR